MPFLTWPYWYHRGRSMSERRCHRHEVDFNEYSSSSGTIANITIATPGLGGTDAKMSVNITSTTAVYYSRGLDWSYYEPELLVRVHIDPNSLTMASGDAFTFLNVRSGSNQLLFLNLRWDGASYEIGGGCTNDAISTQSFSNFDISDAEHTVEVYLLRATSATANNASCILRIDGTNKQTLSSIDCYNVFNAMSAIWVGATAGIDAGTSGIFFLDEVSLRDDDLWPGDYDVPAGTTYYVSNAGSNSNNGTSTSTPWQTLAKIYTEFNNGLFKADDQILFRAGDTFSATNSALFRVRNVKGTRVDKPLTIGRYGSGADPIIDGSSVSGNPLVYGWDAVDFVYMKSMDWQTLPFGVSLRYGARGWRFFDIVLTGTHQAYGLQFWQSDWIQVLYCIVSQIESEGIYVGYSSEPINSTMAVIYACTVSDCGADGIDLKTQTVGCVVRDNVISNADNIDVGDLGNAGIDIRGFGHHIRENNIYDIGNATNTGHIYVGGMIVEENDVTKLRIEFNRVRNIIRPGSVAGYGIKVMGDGNHKILNNTLYQVDDEGIYVSDDTGSTASIVKNNIVHTVTNGLRVSNAVLPDSDYNIYRSTTNNTSIFGVARTIAQACSVNGIECNSSTADPLFVSTTDLTIDETSPAFETAEAAAVNIQLFTDALSKGWHQPNEVKPYCILKDGFELQDFSLWTSSTTDGGNLSVSTGAAIGAGNYGMQAVINNTNAKYVSRSGFGTPRYMHVRIYFDPNGVTMASGDEIDIVQIRSVGINVGQLVFGYNGSSYYLRFTCAEEAVFVTHSSSKYTITDAIHYAEIAYHASAVSAYSRGMSYLKIDGLYKEAFFDMNNDLVLLDEVRVGVCTAPDATMTGTLYWDEIIIDDVGNDMDATATGQAAGSVVSSSGIPAGLVRLPAYPGIMISGR